MNQKEFTDNLLKVCEQRRTAEVDFPMIEFIFQKTIGKITAHLGIPSPVRALDSICQPLRDEDKKELIKIYDKIVTDYDLHKTLKEIYVGKGNEFYDPDILGLERNSRLCYSENFLIGEEIVCCVVLGGFDFPRISDIFYTEDSKDIAIDIWKRYSELCLKLISKHEFNISKLYQVTTVMIGDSGRYYPSKISIQPIVSLTSDDFLDNYNSDLPVSKISEFIQMDRGGIMIFNGTPGCGKSTYLKSLIFKYPETNFIIIPQYLLGNQESFRMFLLSASSEYRNSVIIIEDCEQLLIKRDDNNPGFSSIIGDILNYTDGILGDLTRTKFIFTFNTDLKNIDKAILRPGRLFLKYEFTPLTGENLEKIASKIGKTLTPEEKRNGVPLSNLYLHDQGLDLGGRPKNRIGF